MLLCIESIFVKNSINIIALESYIKEKKIHHPEKIFS